MRSRSLSLQSSSSYWDKLGGEWAKQGRDALWRSYCDARKNALLSRWLPGTRDKRLLKTDTFDEAVAASLYPKLRLHARHLIGIDVSPVIIQAAQTRYPEFDILQADIRSLPFVDGYFDVVLFFPTLDHFDSRDSISQALEELHRVLATKGASTHHPGQRDEPNCGLPQSAAVRSGTPPWTCSLSRGEDLRRPRLDQATLLQRLQNSPAHLCGTLPANAGGTNR